MFTPLDFLPIEYVPDAFAQIQSIPSSDDGPQNYMDTKFYRHIREQLWNLIIPSNVGMLANDQRTTNLLEGPGGTDGFRVIDVSHPDVYKLLISLIREASQNRNNHRCPNSM